MKNMLCVTQKGIWTYPDFPISRAGNAHSVVPAGEILLLLNESSELVAHDTIYKRSYYPRKANVVYFAKDCLNNKIKRYE